MSISNSSSSDNSLCQVRCLYCDQLVSSVSLIEHIADDLDCKPQRCETCEFRCYEQQTLITHGVQTQHHVPLSHQSKTYKEYIVQMVATHSAQAKRGVDLQTLFLPNSDHSNRRSSTNTNTPLSVKKEIRNNNQEKSVDTERSRTNKKRSRSSSSSPSPYRPPKKKCRYCKKLVPESKVDQYKHASTHLPNFHVNCPFCDYRKAGNAEKVERHVRQKHPNDNFTLLDIKEKKELRRKANNCFSQPRRKSSPKRKKLNVEVGAETTVTVAEPVSSLVVPEPVTSVPSTVPSVPNIVTNVPDSVTSIPSLPVPDRIGSPKNVRTIICRICSVSVPDSPSCLKFHVTRKHMDIAIPQQTDQNAAFNKKLSECFQKDNEINIRTEKKDICAVCNRLIKSLQGKKSHVAIHHFQKSINCPYDDCDFTALFPDTLTKHMREKHEINSPRPCRIHVIYSERKTKHTLEVKPDLIRCFPDSFTRGNRRILNISTTSVVQQDRVTSSTNNILQIRDIEGNGRHRQHGFLSAIDDTVNNVVNMPDQNDNVAGDRNSLDNMIHSSSMPVGSVTGNNVISREQPVVERMASNEYVTPPKQERTAEQFHSKSPLKLNNSMSQSRNLSIDEDEDIQFVGEKAPRHRNLSKSSLTQKTPNHTSGRESPPSSGIRNLFNTDDDDDDNSLKRQRSLHDYFTIRSPNRGRNGVSHGNGSNNSYENIGASGNSGDHHSKSSRDLRPTDRSDSKRKTESSQSSSSPTTSVELNRPVRNRRYPCSICEETIHNTSTHVLIAHIWGHVPQKDKGNYLCGKCPLLSPTHHFAEKHWNHSHRKVYGHFSKMNSLKSAIPGNKKSFVNFKRLCFPSLEI